MKENLRNILLKWNIKTDDVIQIYDTAYQVSGERILKVYDNRDELERNINIIMILDEMNVPVGKIVETKERKKYVADGEYYYIISKKLPGSNLVNLKENLSLALEMGRIIANLHVAFLECEKRVMCRENSLLGELKGYVQPVLLENDWHFVSQEQFEKTVSELEKLYDKLPVQLIHRDVHFGNFLFDKDKFSGYIDFDLSQRNIRIFDLCYFAIGLLSEQENTNLATEEWLEILTNVFLGYNEKKELKEEEKQAVPYVMKSIEFIFVAWFLQEKDMDCVKNAVELITFVDNNSQQICESIR